MTEHDIKLALASGLAFTCAMCEHFWVERQPNPDYRWQCRQARLGALCNGPYQGSTFPRYLGPLTSSQRINQCFRCGGPSDLGLQFGAGTTILGACQVHGDELGRWRRSQVPRSYPSEAELRVQRRG